jgi:ABC-type nickel/cobalt efflux system permease component RcnA
VLGNRAHIHFHRHDQLPRHAHWHRHQESVDHQRDPHHHQHAAVLVGLVHGTAGSAPLLGLLPLAKLGSPLLGLGYLAMFSLGVLLTMTVFGGLFAGLLSRIAHWGDRAIRGLRALIGGGAITLGLVWLQRAV